MPYYRPLKKQSASDRNRTVEGLQRLRQQFKDERFPVKKSSSTLILGTWNIRNFDDDRFNYGPRLKESLYYIAEIISRFDVIAVQEICVDLWPLKKLMNILGDNYDYIVTDVTHSSVGGNQERLGFIYDKNKVRFKGVAGEIVLPEKLMISKAAGNKRQFSRTPFGVEFQSGWFNFYFSTVHIFFGSNQGNTPLYKRRVEEIKAIAKYLSKEAKNSDSNHILVGDFNIKERGSDGFNALEENGFKTVKNHYGSNRDQTKFYDQISFRSKKNELTFIEPNRDDRVFQYFKSVFREEDFLVYKPIMKKMIAKKLKDAQEAFETSKSKSQKKKFKGQIESLNEVIKTEDSLKEYYLEWRTFQASDHLPLWVEIKIDFSDQYLEYLKSLD
ncbi:endonuclease/exonuclease/phosphatase family protein [Draconibacterium sp.]|nr:endonuclease/exonuclease/phosphatase family protein [Draconibacterium sp.]